MKKIFLVFYAFARMYNDLFQMKGEEIQQENQIISVYEKLYKLSHN